MVVGHADNQTVKSDAMIRDNYRLSYIRAEKTANRLIKNGIAAEQLLEVGRGDSGPVMNYSDENISKVRKMNRRVEFLAAPSLSAIYGIARG